MPKSNNPEQSESHEEKKSKDENSDEKKTNNVNNEKKLDDDEKIESENETDADISEKLKENVQEELNKTKDQLLRSLAENENIRKRTEKDIEQIKKYGHIFFVRDLMSSVDNLTRAVESVPIEKEKLDEPIKSLIVGVEIVLKEINSFLEKNHITKINPLGEKFDYNFHQAMYEAPSKEFDPGFVVEVIQCGYLLHDRLVRPAMVGIAKKENSKDEKHDNEKNN